jgi:hypothetical protein
MIFSQPFTPNPDVSATELRVLYNAPVFVRYGTGDCFAGHEIPARETLRFASIRCHMNYAYFNKSLNDTSNEILKVDLVRDGQVIKSYSTGNSSVRFSKIDEFLSRSVSEPGLVQDLPITAKILTDGAWSGWVDDKYGGQSASGTGSATLTLVQPVLPAEACFRTRDNSTPAVLAVELYQGEKLLNRSDRINSWGMTCAKFP